jgi:rhomboid protease GluP
VTNYPDFDSEAAPPSPPSDMRLPIPISNPFLTYILLAIIFIVWVLMELAGGSQDGRVLVQFGANFGPRILQGETWRLLTSMFLHIGLAHLFFNAYALFIFGMEMERIYGPDRDITIYILAGLFGSLTSFASRGPQVLSAGASGAIFGVIGMNLAYFLIHRHTFGHFGRQRVMSTLIIIGVNLVFGFTVPGIDNLAHLGGLLAGFAIGYGLAPRYRLVDEYTTTPRLIDTVSLLKRWWVLVLSVAILASGTSLAISFWTG